MPPRVSAVVDPPADTGADTVAVGVFEGEGVAHDLDGGELSALATKTKLGAVANSLIDGRHWLVVGLGSRDEFGAEQARVAAAKAWERARDLGTRVLCWEVPHHVSDAHVAGLVEGTLLAAYEFRVYKTTDDEDRASLDELLVSAHHDVSEPAESARVVCEAVCGTRDLQNTPAADKTPRRLGELARELAEDIEGVSCELLVGDEIGAAGMGSFASVARGSAEPACLITLRYSPADVTGPVLGFVGKAVTFDSGGISLKPGLKMAEMKFDMSGGAAVLYAVAAVARLGLPVQVIGVVGATENMPSGTATKPGDIVRAKNGTTIEVINTDAEGRLVLADCITHALELGAERLIDLATLTGAIVTTFGNVHAGMWANDDAWAAEVEAAGARSGERVWRLPLDPEYAKVLEGKYADLQNTDEQRKASSILGAEFLHKFAGDEVSWAHLDIAGVANDVGRPYAAKGGSGFGVRLLVELARCNAGAPDMH